MVDSIDRYPLPPSDPRKLIEQLRELERRIGELERSNPMQAGVRVRDGRVRFSDENEVDVLRIDRHGMRVLDSDEDLRVSAGRLDAIGTLPAGSYGLEVRDNAGGVSMLRVDENGMHLPFLPASFVPLVNDTSDTRLIRVTSSSWASYYRATVGVVLHQGVGVIATCSTDVGTTAEFRITTTLGSTEAVTVASGESVGQTFNWLHGLALGAGPASFDLECRRTSGGGNAYIWLPPDAWMRTGVGCVADGVE